MNWRHVVSWLVVPASLLLGGWKTPARPLVGEAGAFERPRSFSASVQGGLAFCPGARVQPVVHAVQEDGSRSSRTLDPARYLVRTTGALSQVDDRGGVVLDTDPQRLEAGPLGIRIEAVGRPDLAPVALSVPVHYGCAFHADFRGRAGEACSASPGRTLRPFRATPPG